MKKSNKINHSESHDLPIGDVLIGLGVLALGGVSVYALIADLIA